MFDRRNRLRAFADCRRQRRLGHFGGDSVGGVRQGDVAAEKTDPAVRLGWSDGHMHDAAAVQTSAGETPGFL